ncbi:MAG: hypothetical protein ACI9JZ_002554 [Lentimonas sp.]|jgi:hypothetical protein
MLCQVRIDRLALFDATAVVLDHLGQCGKAAVMHVGVGQGDVA